MCLNNPNVTVNSLQGDAINRYSSSITVHSYRYSRCPRSQHNSPNENMSASDCAC